MPVSLASPSSRRVGCDSKLNLYVNLRRFDKPFRPGNNSEEYHQGGFVSCSDKGGPSKGYRDKGGIFHGDHIHYNKPL